MVLLRSIKFNSLCLLMESWFTKNERKKTLTKALTYSPFERSVLIMAGSLKIGIFIYQTFLRSNFKGQNPGCILMRLFDITSPSNNLVCDVTPSFYNKKGCKTHLVLCNEVWRSSNGGSVVQVIDVRSVVVVNRCPLSTSLRSPVHLFIWFLIHFVWNWL